MRVRFQDTNLDRLETDSSKDGGYAPGIGSAFRRRMQQIRSAMDERDLYALKSLHFEKLKGNRSHQRSLRLNDKWRLILEIEGEANDKTIVIIGIEDYH